MMEQSFDGLDEVPAKRFKRSFNECSETGQDGGLVNQQHEHEEKGIGQCFADFCRQTILHGWHYLVDYDDDDQEEFSDYLSSPNASPNANNFYQPGTQCLCHHPSTNHNLRNRGSKHSATRRNLAKRTYHSQHAAAVPNDRSLAFRDQTSLTKSENRGRVLNICL